MNNVIESALILEKRKSGKKLYIFAWVIEIIAAFIGLMIAWSMGFQTYQFYVNEYGSFPMIHLFDLLLAALPFLMVASIELLKIPFCKLVYLNKSFRIRVLFSIVLVLVTFITFETLITGFERQFNNISIQVSVPQKKLSVLTKKIEYIEESIENLENTTDDSISEEVTLQREEAAKSRDAAIETLKAQKDQFLTISSGTLLKQKDQIEADIKRLIEDRNEIIVNIETRSKLARDSKENEIENIKDRRDEKIVNTEKYFISVSEEEQLNQSIARKANNETIAAHRVKILDLEGYIAAAKEDSSLYIFFSGDLSKWNKEIASLNVKIEKLLDGNSKLGLTTITSLNAEINKILSEADTKITKIEDEISLSHSKELEDKSEIETNFLKNRKVKYEELSEIESKQILDSKYKTEIAEIDHQIQLRQKAYNDEIDRIDAFRRGEGDKLTQKNDEIVQLERELGPYKDQQLELGFSIMEAYEQTQIYRIAKSFYGIEDGIIITEEQISFVAKIWFGSLAGIVSSMGIFLAFGAFIFLYAGNEYQTKKPSGFLKRAFRKTLIARRKKYNEPKIVTKIQEVEVPKEVLKEVPVDKIVIQEVKVDVPVDKIVIQEVPVEVIKKEVVHVPIYTNDPDILNFGTPKVKDIVDGK